MVKAVGAAAVGAKGIFKYIKVTSFALLFILLTFGSIMECIHQRSIYPFLNEVGGTIFLTTENLVTQSNNIITNGGVVVTETNPILKVLAILSIYSTFIILLWMCFVWIKIIAKGASKSFFSYDGNDFVNYFFGIFGFILLQVLFGFIYHIGITHDVSTTADAMHIIYNPILSFVLVFKAIYIILEPLSGTTDKIVNKLNATSPNPL